LAQTIIVFGGSSGIGAAVVVRLAERGDSVLAVGRDPAKLEAIVARTNRKARAHAVDATDRAATEALFRDHGPVDHVVLAHSGGKGAGPFSSLVLDDLRSGLEAKLLSQLNAAQAALPYLRQGGSLTFVSAISSRASIPGTAGLAAINGAIEAAVHTLARELAPLRVNAVAPGVIDTPWWDGMPAEAKAEHFRRARETLPAGRVGSPDDVAAAIALCIDSGFVTGSVIDVAGGAQLP